MTGAELIWWDNTQGDNVTESVDCIVIGAGVVGLAIARTLAQSGREVLVLEAGNAVGTGVSSRSSEVIHGGMYYPQNSLRARLCVQGNVLLRQFAAASGVDFKMVGKLIVATDEDEIPALDAILAKGQANGVVNLVAIPGVEARQWEPDLKCVKALWSPDTGVIDSHGYMMALLAEIEASHGQVVLNAPVLGGQPVDGGFKVEVGGAEAVTLLARTVVLSAGLSSPKLGRAFGLKSVPQDYLCKGNYFTVLGKMPFSRLVYPVPMRDGLGVHYTLDLHGRGRFGPDVEWIETEDYQVDAARSADFQRAISHYWPGVAGRELAPAYAGIRPKIYAPHQNAADFMIHGPQQHGALGLIALYGIESPGLTSSLALAEMVRGMLS